MNRGDRKEAIFRGDPDRLLFVETLAETCAKTGWQVHAYCLMSNHIHLVLETAQANLVAGMQRLLGTYLVMGSTGNVSNRLWHFRRSRQGWMPGMIVRGTNKRV